MKKTAIILLTVAILFAAASCKDSSDSTTQLPVNEYSKFTNVVGTLRYGAPQYYAESSYDFTDYQFRTTTYITGKATKIQEGEDYTTSFTGTIITGSKTYSDVDYTFSHIGTADTTVIKQGTTTLAAESVEYSDINDIASSLTDYQLNEKLNATFTL